MFRGHARRGRGGARCARDGECGQDNLKLFFFLVFVFSAEVSSSLLLCPGADGAAASAPAGHGRARRLAGLLLLQAATGGRRRLPTRPGITSITFRCYLSPGLKNQSCRVVDTHHKLVKNVDSENGAVAAFDISSACFDFSCFKDKGSKESSPLLHLMLFEEQPSLQHGSHGSQLYM